MQEPALHVTGGGEDHDQVQEMTTPPTVELSTQPTFTPDSEGASVAPVHGGSFLIVRRHSTRARGLIDKSAANPLTRGKIFVRRSVSTKFLRRSPSTLFQRSPLPRGSTAGKLPVESPNAVNSETSEAPTESPYDEMMERFQLRQLQRSSSAATVRSDDHRGVVGSNRRLFGSSRGLVSQASGDGKDAGDLAESGLQSHLSMGQDRNLHARHLSRNVTDYASPSQNMGAQPATSSSQHLDDHFASKTSLFENNSGTTHLPKQLNLGFGALDGSSRSLQHGDFMQGLSRLLSHKLLMPISPFSKFAQIRCVVIWLATLTYVLWFPLDLAFPSEHQLFHTDLQIDISVGFVLGLDVLITLHMGYVTKSGAVITSHWLIVGNYIKTRLIWDALLAVALMIHMSNNNDDSQLAGRLSHFVLNGLSIERLAFVTQLARVAWLVRANQSGRANNIWAWLLYSRHSHLLRIAGIVTVLIAIAHYNACIWTILLRQGDDFEDPNMPWTERYSASFYAALLLLQGEGVPTDTTGQNVFASLSTLVGSVVLAVVFGHVAMLVSNFNANFTDYQRKMEAVFAMTAKLQLPVSLRERIHEYYEHLWHEYECLDGEIVQFSKELSHTLGLEVVLFKYMELVMHVPFWRDCTPDFQKQLMLRLDVRVYLPDDFIMRQGEVDDQFYMVNRGYCELSRESQKFERVTNTIIGLGRSNTGINTGRNNGGLSTRRRSSTLNAGQMDDGYRQSAYELDASQRRYYNAGGGRTAKGYESLITRGQAFGDIALLMNYQRAADVRAITHVEICVLSRDNFQEVLARYPEDRRRVVVDMLTSYMQSYETSQLRCPLLELVRSVYSPEAIAEACAKAGSQPPFFPQVMTARQAAERIYTAINADIEDSSLKFGVGVHVREQLITLRERRRKRIGSKRSAVQAAASAPNGFTVPPIGQHANNNGRLDSQTETKGTAIAQAGSSATATATPSVQTSQIQPQTSRKLTFQERLKQVEEREVAILRAVQDLQSSLKILQARQAVPTDIHSRKRNAPGDDATLSAVPTASRQPLLKRMGSLVHRSSGSSMDPQPEEAKVSPTRYADQLFNAHTAEFQLTQSQQCPTEQQQNMWPRLSPSINSRRSLTIPSETDTLTSETSQVEGQQSSEAPAFSTGRTTQSLQPRTETAPIARRSLFDRKKTPSLRILEEALQPRTASSSAMAPVEPPRKKFFQRGQSLRVVADARTPQHPPRPSIGSSPTHPNAIFQRMSALVTDTSNLNARESPTRYADALFRKRSTPLHDALNAESQGGDA